MSLPLHNNINNKEQRWGNRESKDIRTLAKLSDVLQSNRGRIQRVTVIIYHSAPSLVLTFSIIHINSSTIEGERGKESSFW